MLLAHESMRFMDGLVPRMCNEAGLKYDVSNASTRYKDTAIK